MPFPCCVPGPVVGQGGYLVRCERWFSAKQTDEHPGRCLLRALTGRRWQST